MLAVSSEVEHCALTAGVVGSNPTRSALFRLLWRGRSSMAEPWDVNPAVVGLELELSSARCFVTLWRRPKRRNCDLQCNFSKCDSSSIDLKATYQDHLMMTIQMIFGEKVRAIRELNGWSQEDLADYSGLHRTYISGVERGVRNPTIEIVSRIASALGVEVAHLFEPPTSQKKS
jgi:DNA-binding XRE family transcriptional regulator